ncbi:MAG: YraN family protein [Candidatus Omnitrophica bacterium]|nr:YraN family protein [Candidatus Omnitrophota bacterium]
MTKERLALGIYGEEAAIAFLKERGYRLVCRNYKTFLGEIDIIADDHGTCCFIEVKTRTSEMFGLPQEAVSARKQYKLSQIAALFLKERNLLDCKARFDVVSVICPGVKAVTKIQLFKNAFEARKG